MNIIDFIPTGRKNAIKRKDLVSRTGFCDRDVRKAIEHARESTVIVCLSNGEGYFQPGEDDDMYVREYIRQEISRINHIEKSIKLAKFRYL